MPLVGTKANAGAFGLGWSSGPAGEVLGGMVLMTPTSIVSAGTGNSSSISANGSVTFSSCSSVSLNGVFTSEYDNYMLVIKNTSVSGGTYCSLRYRENGVDNTSTIYTYQQLAVSGSNVAGGRATSQNLTEINYSDSTTMPSGSVIYIYGPNLAQPTVGRELEVRTYASAGMCDEAHGFSGNNQFDGITILEYYGNRMSGIVSVYGLGG